MKKFAIFFILAAAISVGTAEAASTLTFDELPYQSVDGLSYEGVTFGFSIAGTPSTDAYYGAEGPGTLAYVQGLTLEGNTRGILTLDFAAPTDTLSFGIAFNNQNATDYAYQVELFDESLTSLGIWGKGANTLVYWAEDKFSYSGTAISRAVIDFDQYYSRRFAIDNLTNLSANTIPAPGAILLGSFGAGLVGWLRRRRTL